ncbi:MAG: twin-arginine translocation signal domain-containing protein, partial [Verrucomicrobiota bacterium]
MISRRKTLQTLATGVGAAVGSSVFPGVSHAAASASGGPKRVIFFLQNQGFEPATAIPHGMVNSGSLAGAKLPEPIQALEPV